MQFKDEKYKLLQTYSEVAAKFRRLERHVLRAMNDNKRSLGTIVAALNEMSVNFNEFKFAARKLRTLVISNQQETNNDPSSNSTRS